MLLTDKTKVDLLKSLHPVRSGVKYEHHTITVNHGVGCEMVWDCFVGSGPGQLAVMDGTMNSALEP